MPRVIILQHAEPETPGRIETILLAEGFEPEVVRPYAGEPVPVDLGTAEGLVVLGGPMGVNDQKRLPYLVDEMKLIERALKWEAPVLGVCLGSQLLAAVLGAPVTRGPLPEIGWYPVRLTPEASRDPLWAGVASSFVPFHWHGDILALPSGAAPLAKSDLTPHQAFRHGTNAYGFLFHIEVQAEHIDSMCAAFPEVLEAAGLKASEIRGEASRRLSELRPIADKVLRAWARLLKQQ